LEEATEQIFDPKQREMDKIAAKLSRDEEKVLKHERESERQRHLDDAKARKLEEQEAKKKAKEEAAEKKRREREEAVQAREDAKRKKEEEKVQEEQAKKVVERKKKKSLANQKNSFLLFFNVAKKSESKLEQPRTHTLSFVNKDFDTDLFRSKINSMSEKLSLVFDSLSSRALSSRKRRTKSVAVTVYTTVTTSESQWEAPAYAEQKTIMVPNKYRFLSFHEDCRPAYHGTWSKKSFIVTGKTPFGKDSKVFDYDYDSEAEWEDGDDEVGEDVDDDAKNEEEDSDDNIARYDYEDGFCVADDKMLDNEENADEETRAMYKKKLQSEENDQQLLSNRVRIMAPGPGGIPLPLSKKMHITCDRFEGMTLQDVADAVKLYRGETLHHLKICLDAFPQLHFEDEKSPVTSTVTNVNTKDKDEYTKIAMIAMVRTVHHSTHNSKEKVVEDLRSSHPSLFSVRAKATRRLDSIATKQKHPTITGGYYWEVKKEVLDELGLTDLVGKPLYSPVKEAIADPEKISLTRHPSTKKRKRISEEIARATHEENAPKNEVVQRTNEETPSKKIKLTRSVTKGKKGSATAADSMGMKNLMANFLKKK
jgi:hypothetical protein